MLFDADGTFRSTRHRDQIRRLAVQGAGATIGASIASVMIQVVSTAILGRLLTPRDFGVVTIVTTVSLLLMNCGGNGLTEAILQRDHLNVGIANNLFWISLGIGVFLAGGLACLGSSLASIFHESRVVHVAVGMALTIFITNTSVVQTALLKRSMRFSALSVNDIVSRAVSAVVAISCASARLGYWALVAGAVTQCLSQSIGVWILCRWLPGVPRLAEGTGAALRFAASVYARFAFNYFSRNADNVLVGWYFSASALGYYKKAYDLFALSAGVLTSSISSVAVGALSRFSADSFRYRRYVFDVMIVITFVGMGISGVLTLVGEDLIRVLLGPGWERAGKIFTLFGPGIGVMLLYNTHGWIHLSVGKPNRWLRWGVIEFALTALLFVAALPWGPAGVALAWTASFWILTIPALWYAGKPVNFDTRAMVRRLWRFPVASLSAGVASWLIVQALPSLGGPSALVAFLRVCVSSAIFCTLYLGSVALLHWGLEPFHLIARILGEMLPGRDRGELSVRGSRDERPIQRELVSEQDSLERTRG